MAEILLLVGMAFIAGLVDASLGMMFGTILSPFLILMGFEPLIAIPSILLSQSLSGIVAAHLHHRHGNVDLSPGSEDFRTGLTMMLFGAVGVVGGVLLAINMPADVLVAYIAAMVMLMGAVVLSGRTFPFSWRMIGAIALISGFNKSLSGGGFGPLLTSGQMMAGIKGRAAVGIASLSKGAVGLLSFAFYYVLSGFSSWGLLMPMLGGALAAAIIAPRITKELEHERLKSAIGIMSMALGALMLFEIISAAS